MVLVPVVASRCSLVGWTGRAEDSRIISQTLRCVSLPTMIEFGCCGKRGLTHSMGKVYNTFEGFKIRVLSRVPGYGQLEPTRLDPTRVLIHSNFSKLNLMGEPSDRSSDFYQYPMIVYLC